MDSWFTIKPVNPKGNQSWIFIAKAPILWPHEVKKWLIGKDPDAGRDYGQEKKGMTEDEMAGWHHQLDGHEFEWTPGDGEGQGGLVCCDSWGHKESDVTERLNWTELNWTIYAHEKASTLVHSSTILNRVKKETIQMFNMAEWMNKCSNESEWTISTFNSTV